MCRPLNDRKVLMIELIQTCNSCWLISCWRDSRVVVVVLMLSDVCWILTWLPFILFVCIWILRHKYILYINQKLPMKKLQLCIFMFYMQHIEIIRVNMRNNGQSKHNVHTWILLMRKISSIPLNHQHRHYDALPL